MPKKNLEPRLILPKAAIAGFKRRALTSQDEILAFLVGSITRENDTITKIVVKDLVYPDVQAASGYVTWDLNDMIKIQVQVQPDQILGTLHSHPDEEPHISKADVETAVKYGELVSGIFSYWRVGSRRRTSFDWYHGAVLLKSRLL